MAFSLGSAPLANALREPDAPASDREYPLDLVLCGSCSLLQLGETVEPSVLFGDYPYFSSVSTTMVNHAASLADGLIDSLGLDSGSLVIEIGSNDGYLLGHLARRDVAVLGIDPAAEAAQLAIDAGVPTITGFFSTALAEEIAADGRSAAVIVANNVMAHVPDVNDIVRGIVRLLGPDGVFVMETPYVIDLIDQMAFDTIYHEHVFYYSVSALSALLESHGLHIQSVERIPIHGGSIRVTAGRKAAPDQRIQSLLDDEIERGIASVVTYRRFARQIEATLANLRRFLEARRAAGHRLAGYGAAAKTTMLVNLLGESGDLLEFVVDRNPRKQGRYIPGTDLLIYPVEVLLDEMPDEVVLFPWNIADEVLRQEAEYQRRGGRFIIPLPEPRIAENVRTL